MDKTYLQQRMPVFSWPVLLLAGLSGGALVFLALISRVYGFWFLSRWPRLFLFGIGTLVCGLLVGLALRKAQSLLSAPPRAGKLAWLGGALFVGILLIALGGRRAPAMPMLYVLDISTTAAPGSGETNGGAVVFIELRDFSGNPVLPVDFQMEGEWQRKDEGWVVQSSQAARLHYSFYAPPEGKLQVLFGEQPDGGEVQVDLNGKTQRIDLRHPVYGQRLVDLPFRKQSRWEKPIFIANLTLMGLALPLFLFVAPFYAVRGARWSWRWLQSASGWLPARLDYQKIFIAAFLGLCLLPLFDYHGDIQSLERFFMQGNSYWPVYSQIRQKVFGDRLIGGALIGKNGWLILANDFSLEDYQNAVPLTKEELYQMQQRVDGATRFLKKKGTTLLIVIPPNKNTIYPEEVPEQVQVIGEQSRLDQLLAYQRSHGEVEILDLRPALLEAKKEHLVYYRTDTHWNYYGAHAAYVEIMKRLQKALPEFSGLEPHPLSEYRYAASEDNIGDIGWRWAVGNALEPFFHLEPTFQRRIQKFDSVENRVIYSHQYNLNGENLPTAVVFHDSFMDWLGPFLADHFQRTVFVRALDMENGMDEKLIEAEKPDIVIYECNERILRMLTTFSGHVSNGE